MVSLGINKNKHSFTSAQIFRLPTSTGAFECPSKVVTPAYLGSLDGGLPIGGLYFFFVSGIFDARKFAVGKLAARNFRRNLV